MIKSVKILIAVTVISLAFSNCSSAGKSTERISESANHSEKTSDYFGKDVVFAAFTFEDGGFSETAYYPSKIISPANEGTKFEYQVTSLIQSTDVEKGATKWTKNIVLKSHPAAKEELKEGMIVLYVHDTTPRSKEDLKNHSIWNRGVVVSTDELYKDKAGIIFLWYLDRKDESDRTGDIPLIHIRIIDDPDMPAVKRFMK